MQNLNLQSKNRSGKAALTLPKGNVTLTVKPDDFVTPQFEIVWKSRSVSDKALRKVVEGNLARLNIIARNMESWLSQILHNSVRIVHFKADSWYIKITARIFIKQRRNLSFEY